ncbi:MAG: agmatinase [bacterium]
MTEPPPRERFLAAETSFEDSYIALFGCPYDATATFRSGARKGPEAIRRFSDALETYSPELENDLGKGPFSDMGDLELPDGRADEVLEVISEHSRRVMSAGKIPFALGGEHLITLPLVIAALEFHPDLVVFQWDAHADLRSDYEGNVLSHATVMRRVAENIGDDRFLQFGVRSGTREEWKWMKKNRSVRPLASDHVMAGLVEHQGRPIYLSVDLDVLDPSECPGTGTPEPGGSTFLNLAECIHTLRLSGVPVVALDVVELAPEIDPTGRSAVAAAKIVRELLLSLRV